LHSVTKWTKVGDMINKFGLPVRNYCRSERPIRHETFLDAVIMALLRMVRASERFLEEKTVVPRRISTFSR
jgi:hypothetical protein